MKRLVIIRHAKTEQQGYDRDFTRELTDRGIADAKLVAQALKEKGIFPDKVLASPATRAITTAKIMADILNFNTENIVELKRLYFDYSTQDFVDLIHETDDAANTLFVVAHNPFMHFMAQNMSKEYYGHMPTSSTVVLDFDVDAWGEIEPRQGELLVHLYPRMLKE